MLVLGIGGGLDLVGEARYSAAHDSAAILVEDGKIVFGIEEERLNRIKHSDKAPVLAMKACLDHAGKTIDDVDRIAVYGAEEALNMALRTSYLGRPERGPFETIRDITRRLLSHAFSKEVSAKVLTFVPHHLAHAASSYYVSGFDQALVMTMDGHGDGVSTTISHAEGPELKRLATWTIEDSLGFFYIEVIRFLGYEMFDEYKVMGLAPYGNPAKFRRILKKLYSLKEDGGYKIHLNRITLLFEALMPRKRGEPFTQTHRDLAAGLQEALERIVFHVLMHYRRATGVTNLCLAGGVALNCTLNGKILYSKMFEHMFVQPLAHDAGAALGAALCVQRQLAPKSEIPKFDHLYTGTPIGDGGAVQDTLHTWRGLASFEKLDDAASAAATLLAEGQVIGWVQGRSELGPRALGNRSILADPRPAENRKKINAMVKKREAYRPFAPSVLEENATEHFDLPGGADDLGHMIYVVKVREDQRELLGAITHVDGTARIQTVSKQVNPLYWRLIKEFEKRTGVPIVLNTSFNNNAEPIVNSVDDAVVCFLTTKLDSLIIGDYLVRRVHNTLGDTLDELCPSTLPHIVMDQRVFRVEEKQTVEQRARYNSSTRHQAALSVEAFEAMKRFDGIRSIKAIVDEVSADEAGRKALADELVELWSRRYFRVRPMVRGLK